MKLKEKLAKKFVSSIVVPTEFPELDEACFVAGFETARKMMVDFLEEYTCLDDIEADRLTEVRGILLAVKNLGEENV